MNALSKVLGLVLLSTLGVAPSHARPGPAPTAPRAAINPQPLPPRHDGSARIAINPQPLPPSHDGSARIAINPQPLPPRGPDPAQRSMPAKPYIGETEKN
jgi:hypothetical protein